MVRVQQGVQNRYFMYDSLGRALRVKQPEQEVNTALNTTGNPDNNSWTAGFAYDNNGNVLTTTDAKGTTIMSTYDALNRPQTRTYSDGTPTVTNSYDDQTVPYSKGKLTKVTSSISETTYTGFDVAGRLLSSTQRTPLDGETVANATPRTSSYVYNLSGALVEETYPSGRKVRNEFETDGDLAKVTSQKAGGSVFAPYASNISYSAAGAVTSMKLGNGKWETTSFNSRLQPVQLGFGASVADTGLWKVNYEYGELQANGTVDAVKNNGNIAKQTLTVPGTNFVQGYKYDPLNRLTEAKETTGTAQNWIQNFGYDIYGNRSAFTQNISGNTTAPNPTVDANTNRFVTGQGFTYDKNGNVINDIDAVTSQSRTFIFNGDNKQTEVIRNGVTLGRYYYDGEGKRVKKVTDTETTVFVYSAGKLVAEYSTLVAAPSEAKIAYTTTDHLGSPRIITDQLGQVKSRRDFMPFGEELNAGVGGRTGDNGLKYSSSTDNVRQKFTGYQKDTETSLDFAEARMYENRFGRFTAVDPLITSGSSADPQTFNRFVYVSNNPLNLIDPTGEKAEITIDVDKEKKTGVIKIKASFAIYAKGGIFSAKDLKAAAKKFETEVRKSYNQSGGFNKDGIKYTVEANVTFTTVDSEKAAIQSGADNIVGLMNSSQFLENADPNNPTYVQGKTYRIGGESFDRIVVASASDDPNLGGHEFGHGLGRGGHLEDGHPPGTIIPGIMAGGSSPSTTYMSSQDFDHLFSGPIRNHQGGRLVNQRVQSSVRSVVMPQRIYPASTTAIYRATAVYNRNVVP